MIVNNWDSEFEKIQEYQKISNKDVYENIPVAELENLIVEYSDKRRELEETRKEFVEKLNEIVTKQNNLSSEIGLMQSKIDILKQRENRLSTKLPNKKRI